MEKIVKIGNQEVALKATANTPKRYRDTFNKDLIVELQKLYAHVDQETGTFIGEVNLEVVENLAYIMAKQANNKIKSIDDWLDDFEATDIYNSLPAILGVWASSTETLSTP